ncbi:unnamed protein product [Mytilus coruscus]|uniref:exodeoxyribonuclease III n=1 Tax=Mytilus coruscus TaxID=42192 RepID=A0A6J8A2V5_MYTCO|nr:unnamed protein product [Mytilus coruscus]
MGDKSKRNALFQWCQKKNFDFICLQETHCTKIVEKEWKKEWGGLSFWCNGTSVSKGVAILVKPNLDINVTEKYRDGEGRKLIVELKLDSNETVRIFNVYAPNNGIERKNFFNKLIINNENDVVNYVMRDFNCCLNRKLDRKHMPKCEAVGNHELKNFIEKNELTDIWRLRYPNKKQYTFSRGQSYSRIDYILTSENIDCRLNNAKTVYFPFSDHDGVTISMNIIEPERGPGYWKMNNSVIKTDLFKNTFETFWKSWKLNINKFKDKKEFWDLTKTKIKDITITISKKLRLNENEVKNWEHKLENLLENDGTQQNLNENKVVIPSEISLKLIQYSLNLDIVPNCQIKWNNQYNSELLPIKSLTDTLQCNPGVKSTIFKCHL